MKEAEKRPLVNELTEEERELVQLLIDRLPQEEIDAARVYLRVLKSQAADPTLWFGGGTPNNTNIHSQRKDLIYRSLWFAEDHVLSLMQITNIFHLGLMFREEMGLKNEFNEPDLRNLISALILNGNLGLQPNMRLKLSLELAKKSRAAYLKNSSRRIYMAKSSIIGNTKRIQSSIFSYGYVTSCLDYPSFLSFPRHLPFFKL